MPLYRWNLLLVRYAVFYQIYSHGTWLTNIKTATDPTNVGWIFNVLPSNYTRLVPSRYLSVFWDERKLGIRHPRRPRGGPSGREKRRDKSFQAQVEKPLGTDSHWTISKRSSQCWLLIGHKKCFVLLCPIGEQHLLSSFRELVHDGYGLDHSLSGSCTKEMQAVRNLSVWYKRYISKY